MSSSDASEKSIEDRIAALDAEPTVRLRDYSVEDYVVLALFWMLAAVVFAQFFSRYVLDASVVWTEEMARYLLIAVTFLGSSLALRRNSHIFVGFLYLYLPPGVSRSISSVVDLVRIVFFGLCTWLTWSLVPVMHRQSFVTVELPMSLIYLLVLAGFAVMTLRSLQVARRNWRHGYHPLSKRLGEDGLPGN